MRAVRIAASAAIAFSLVMSAGARAQAGSMQRVPGPSPKPPKRSAPPREPTDVLTQDDDDGWYRKRLACDSKLKKSKSERRSCKRGR